jgi:heptosyltransferase-2
MRKILVLRGGALGDFIVTLPTLALLRRRWPEARIELVGNARAAELARARGLIDAVHSQHEARWSALFGGAPLTEPMATWLTSFDLVLNYWPDPDTDLPRHFPRRTDQVFLTWPAMPTLAPAAAHYAAALRAFDLGDAAPWFPLQPLASDAAVAGTSPLGVALHPGSGSARKNWPLERWREVTVALPGPITVILGEAELETRGPALAALLTDPRVVPAINLPLETLVAQLARCALFLGHDSGISHLAAATGIPCLLLFGPTDPSLWAPPASTVRVLRRGPEMAAIAVEDVRAELQSLRPCV